MTKKELINAVCDRAEINRTEFVGKQFLDIWNDFLLFR